HCQHPVLRPRSPAPARASRRSRRAVHRRRRFGPRLSGPARIDRRAVHCKPLPAGFQRAPLSDWRLCPLSDRWLSRVPGRLDHQVKVRGHRIELGEVEVVLGQHPQVRERVVVARRDSSGENRLVAYVVPRDSVALTYGQLRDYLKPKLPAYMIPSALVVLDALPLTANGKLDRRALPEPDGKGAVVSGGYTVPRTVVEERLAVMWAEALGLERVGIHDNFFELGGHSLLAIGLFTRIEAAFQRSVPLAILFRAQTVSELAAILVEVPDLDPRPRTVTLRTGDSRRLPLFLVHSRSGDHLGWRPLINHLGTDRPVLGLTLPEKNGVRQTFCDI